MYNRRRCDDVWYRDPAVLATRWYEFFPMRRQTDAERVNAAVRLMLYVSLAVWLYNNDVRYLAIALAAVALASVAFEMRDHRHSRHHSHSRRHSRRQRCRRRPRCNEPRRPAGPPPSMMGPPPTEAYVDEPAPPAGACTRSSPDNPFANFLPTDDPERPPACTFDAMEDDVRANFNQGLFRNAYDVYERENSQRQFNVMPVTTATADTRAFADFLFATPPGRTKDEFLSGAV